MNLTAFVRAMHRYRIDVGEGHHVRFSNMRAAVDSALHFGRAPIYDEKLEILMTAEEYL